MPGWASAALRLPRTGLQLLLPGEPTPCAAGRAPPAAAPTAGAPAAAPGAAGSARTPGGRDPGQDQAAGAAERG